MNWGFPTTGVRACFGALGGTKQDMAKTQKEINAVLLWNVGHLEEFILVAYGSKARDPICVTGRVLSAGILWDLQRYVSSSPSLIWNNMIFDFVYTSSNIYRRVQTAGTFWLEPSAALTEAFKNDPSDEWAAPPASPIVIYWRAWYFEGWSDNTDS